jgi:hypothetical protein
MTMCPLPSDGPAEPAPRGPPANVGYTRHTKEAEVGMAQKNWEISGGGDALRARRDSQRPPTRRLPAHAAGLTRGER